MPLYRPITQAIRNPNSSALSGTASEMGDPLEQAAYLRGRMKAQEFIQQKQTTEANQNRLLAAQEESERRNAAREAMAEQRFTQAQKMDAERMAQQDETQARVLAHQQFLEKFNMAKETAAEERARLKEERDQAKFDAAVAAQAAKDKEAQEIKDAEAEVAQVNIDGKLPSEQLKMLVSLNRQNPKAFRTILEKTKEYKKQSASYEALKASMANLNMENAGWFRPDGMIPHPFNQTVNVLRGYDKSGAAIIGQASESEAEANGWKILTRDPETKAVLIGGVPMPDAPKEPDFGGLLASDAAPVVPQTSPMAPPAVAPVAAPAAAPAAVDPNIVTRTLKDGTTVRVRRTANGWEEVE